MSTTLQFGFWERLRKWVNSWGMGAGFGYAGTTCHHHHTTIIQPSSSPNTTPSAPQKTITVRIAVAIAEDGRWWADGNWHMKDGEAAEMARSGIDPKNINCSAHYVEAEIPVPVATTIKAK